MTFRGQRKHRGLGLALTPSRVCSLWLLNEGANEGEQKLPKMAEMARNPAWAPVWGMDRPRRKQNGRPLALRGHQGVGCKTSRLGAQLPTGRCPSGGPRIEVAWIKSQSPCRASLVQTKSPNMKRFCRDPGRHLRKARDHLGGCPLWSSGRVWSGMGRPRYRGPACHMVPGPRVFTVVDALAKKL